MAAGAVHIVPAGHVDAHRRRPARDREGRPAGRARRRARDRRDEGAGRRGRRAGDGRPDDAVGRRDDPRPPARPRRRRVDAARAARGRRLRPGAGRLAAGGGAGRELAQRARPRGRGRRARCARTRSRRWPPTRPRGCSQQGWSGARARPRHARARRAARRLRDRLHRPRAAPRARPDARAPWPGSATAPPTRRCSRTRSARWPGASRTGSRRSAIRPRSPSRIRARTGAGGLRELGVDRAVLPECADAAAARPQLANTPPAADRAEILALYESAL